MDIIEIFLDSNLLSVMVRKINSFAEQERRTNQVMVSSCSRSKKWMPTTEREINLFLVLIIPRGIILKSNQSLYWSQGRVLYISVYSKLRFVRHFILILPYLYFCTNETEKKNRRLFLIQNCGSSKMR